MTRKDYVLTAEAIANAVKKIKLKEPQEDQEVMLDGVAYVVDFLVESFGKDNPSFNADKFLSACKPH